jgi:hypothetical protein
MYRVVIKIVVAFLCVFVLGAGNVHAARDKTLVTINGREYTDQDYRDWWMVWQEPGMEFFDSPREFIDFHLLAEQGRQMEYHLTPGFQRKVEVFLKVRALAALKNEEVDTKVKISEEQIRAYFNKNYAPIWSLQILTYAEQGKAAEVFEILQGFNGQKAGRLVFADQAGVKPEDGGPLYYEEVSVYPAAIAKAPNGDKWLQVLAPLDKGFVAEPFILEGTDNYIVLRLDDISAPTEENFAKLHGAIEKELSKGERDRLSGQLLTRLRAKYHVKVDEDLLQTLTLAGEYQPEFLAQPVVEIDGGLSLSVEALLFNVKQQQELRYSLSEDELKRLVVGFYISNTLTDQEALGRHYEEKPPIKSVYEFFINNNLRKFLYAGLRARVVVKEEEVQAYFDNNRAEYTKPDKISYVMLEGSQGQLDEIGRTLAQGADFYDQARDNSLDAEIKTVEADALPLGLADILRQLRKGETAPFSYQGRPAMVRLVDRVAGKVASIDEVRSKIEESLRQKKYLVVEAEYLAKARALADVKVNARVWNKLKKEYNNAKNL